MYEPPHVICATELALFPKDIVDVANSVVYAITRFVKFTSLLSIKSAIVSNGVSRIWHEPSEMPIIIGKKKISPGTATGEVTTDVK